MEAFLLVLTFGSFLIFWVTVIFFYTPVTFNLREMLDSIDETGNLTRTKAPLTAYLTSLETVDNWIMTTPTSDKYLKYDEVKRATTRIKKLRKLIYILTPIMVIGGAILLLTVDK
jgi:hypothetical protein